MKKILIFILVSSFLTNYCTDAWHKKIKEYANSLNPLFKETYLGNLDNVKKLIAMGEKSEEKDERGETILMFAIRQKNNDVFNYLLDQKVEINYYNNDGLMPIHVAIEVGNFEKFKKLFKLMNFDLSIKTKAGIDILTFAKNKYEIDNLYIHYHSDDIQEHLPYLRNLKKIVKFIKIQK